MGCYSLGKLISRALGSHKNKDNRRRRGSPDRTTPMSAPPSYCHATRSVAKTVTFSNNNPILIIPSAHLTLPPKHHSETPASSSATATAKPETPEPQPVGCRVESVHGGGVYSSSQQETVERPGMSYTMTPLPRWEEEDRRRREYFGGEYSYYPTPLRDGIYSFATDANRLTSMFSEENPNACSIV